MTDLQREEAVAADGGVKSSYGPAGWSHQPLGELIRNISAGVSISVDERPARAGEKGILKLSAIADGRLKASENKAVRGNGQRLGPAVTGGTLLVSRSNTVDLVGACAYVDADQPDLHLPDLIWEVRIDDEQCCDPRWLNYALATESVRSAIRARATGTSGSMKKLSMAAFRSIPVLKPPLAEQQAIVAILDKWNDGIRQLQRLIKDKRRLKRGLMQQILTGKRRFKEFEGQPWQEYHLGEIFTERNEIGREDLPLLSITANRGVIPRDQTDRKDTSNVNKSRYKRIAPGDVGYNTMRMWQGVSAVSELEGIVSPAYTVCTPSADADSAFIGYLFKFPPVVHLFHRHSQGLVSDTLNLKFPHFAKIKITLPPLDEQKQIAEVLRTADREIEGLQRLRQHLQEQKNGLMQKLLSGQVRVPIGIAE